MRDGNPGDLGDAGVENFGAEILLVSNDMASPRGG